MTSIFAPHSSSPLARMNRGASSLTSAFAMVCFTLVLGTDVLYWQTSNLMWLEFSAWLLLVGIVAGVAALPFGAVEFFRNEDIRTEGGAWAHAAGRVIVLVLAFLNNLVHAADGWTAVVPYGLLLSALTVLLMVAIAWLGAWLQRRSRMEVRRYV